jgi:hypothetical protein
MVDGLLVEPLRQLAGDRAGPIVGEQARRRRAALCVPCLGKGINRIYTVKDHGHWQGAANAALAAAASPLQYVPGGYAIEGLEDEASLLAGAVNCMNAGELEAAARFKRRLDALIASKYGAEYTRADGLLVQVSRGGWRRGATIPRDPLLYHSVGGALLRNKDHDARGAQAIFGDLDALCDALEPDPGYRACIAAMRDVNQAVARAAMLKRSDAAERAVDDPRRSRFIGRCGDA